MVMKIALIDLYYNTLLTKNKSNQIIQRHLKKKIASEFHGKLTPVEVS